MNYDYLRVEAEKLGSTIWQRFWQKRNGLRFKLRSISIFHSYNEGLLTDEEKEAFRRIQLDLSRLDINWKTNSKKLQDEQRIIKNRSTDVPTKSSYV
jgi:hypothetical protein